MRVVVTAATRHGAAHEIAGELSPGSDLLHERAIVVPRATDRSWGAMNEGEGHSPA